ncbi:MAG: double zinc ribbon domain-containing protein [Desulfobulbales bacterium]
MKSFFRAMRDIIFPMYCLGCGKPLPGYQEISYCAVCLPDVRLLQSPFCTKCGSPFERAAGESHLCGVCLKTDWHFTQARAAVRYQPPVAEAVRMFKYRSKMHTLATFAALAQQYLARHPLEEPDVIVPIPLNIKRLRQRGFNQALVLCRKLFPNQSGKINPHVLERHAWTQPQAGLNGPARRRNVKDAFRVCRPEKVENKKILLVDDVFTTGATVNECARILQKDRPSRVDVFTFARVVE